VTEPLARRLLAEGIGSAMLFAAVIGSGIMAERLAGGNVALALLANGAATGAMLFVLITILGPISGAHLNPAVSLVMAFRGELGWRDTAPYVLAQLLCGIAGAWLAHLMFDVPILQVSTHMRAGPGQWTGEAVATFGLVLTILGAARQRPSLVAAAVAPYIAAAYWFTSSTSFANPAITVARSLTDSFSGIAPRDVPMFVLFQLVGAVLGALTANLLFPAKQNKRPDDLLPPCSVPRADGPLTASPVISSGSMSGGLCGSVATRAPGRPTHDR
jgi:glycerol uptake facilitator-like aquaporin